MGVTVSSRMDVAPVNCVFGGGGPPISVSSRAQHLIHWQTTKLQPSKVCLGSGFNTEDLHGNVSPLIAAISPEAPQVTLALIDFPQGHRGRNARDPCDTNDI